MSDIVNNLALIRERIVRAASAAERDGDPPRLIAVSKQQPLQKLRAAIDAGQSDFGENYLQEALDKIRALEDRELTWHFIGPIQSNKTRDIAAHFDWVHSVDRFKIARRLSEQRPPELPALNICMQINISEEDSKSGVAPESASELAVQISELPRLALRGLMAIPAPAENEAAQRRPFAALRELMHKLNANGLDMDTLSMGMSDDLEAAVAEGATLLRVGTAVFGAR